MTTLEKLNKELRRYKTKFAYHTCERELCKRKIREIELEISAAEIEFDKAREIWWQKNEMGSCD